MLSPSPGSGLDHPPFAPGGDISGKLYFLHIQKCAGTSVRAFLESLVHPSAVLGAYLNLEIPDHSVLGSSTLRLIRGHMTARLIDAFPAPPAVVTTLRDPVARLQSHFQFEKKWRHSYALQSLSPIGDIPLERALDIPHIRSLLFNFQTRALMACRPGDQWTMPVASHPSGHLAVVPAIPIDEMIDSAIATLDSMLWVGITEFIDDCMPVLAWHVGSSPTVDLPVTNTLDESKPVQLPVWAADVVAEMTAADEVVYRHGVEIARRAISAYRREDHLRRWAGMLAERAIDLDSEIVLRADEPFGGSSWWPAEYIDGESPLRWSGPADRATIDLPLRVRAGDSIVIRILATIKPEFLVELSMEVNGRHVSTVLDLDGGVTLRGILPAGVEGPWTSITIRCPTVPWRDVHPGSVDPGRRGLAFEHVRLTPAGQ